MFFAFGKLDRTQNVKTTMKMDSVYRKYISNKSSRQSRDTFGEMEESVVTDFDISDKIIIVIIIICVCV